MVLDMQIIAGDLENSFSEWDSPAAGGGDVQPVPGGETASGGYYPGLAGAAAT